MFKENMLFWTFVGPKYWYAERNSYDYIYKTKRNLTWNTFKVNVKKYLITLKFYITIIIKLELRPVKCDRKTIKIITIGDSLLVYHIVVWETNRKQLKWMKCSLNRILMFRSKRIILPIEVRMSSKRRMAMWDNMYFFNMLSDIRKSNGLNKDEILY